jgi:hypothetical protein
MTTYSDSYWNRREEADEERERQATPLDERPEFGPVEPPPPTPADVAPTPPGVPEADFEPFPTAKAAPAAPAADDGMKAQRLKAIERMRQLSEAPNEPPEGLRDSDIAAASQRDRQQVQRDNFTEALAAAIARRPARMQSAPSESASLAQRRAMSDTQTSRKMDREMTANARLAAALKGDPAAKSAGGLTEYQREQLKRADADDAYRKDKDTKKAESDAAALVAGRKAWAPVLREMNIDPEMATQKDIDRAMQRDSSLATRELARSQFGYKQQRDVQDDQKDLGKTLGAEPEHLSGLIGRLKSATTAEDIPGVGPLDSKIPDVLSGDAALQNRNDMREAVRIMLAMKSGKTVTPQEAADYAKIYGTEGSEEAFRQGVRRLEADIADTIRAKKAGFSPKAREAYESAGGAKTPTKPTAPITKNAGDWVQLRRKNGDTIKATRSDADAFLSAHPGEATIEEIR